MRRLLGLALMAPLCACQLILGFEDHELGTGVGGAGSTGTADTTNTGSTGGAPPNVEFGPGELLTTAPGPLTDVVASPQGAYVLSPGDGRIYAVTDAGRNSALVQGLVEPRGLVLDQNLLYTTTGDGSAGCAVRAYDLEGQLVDEPLGAAQPGGANCFEDVGAEGSFVAAIAADGVYAGTDGDMGTYIGEQAPGMDFASLFVANARYFWIDRGEDEVYRSAGEPVQGMAPGNKVMRVARGLSAPVALVVRGPDLFAIGQTQVGRVEAAAEEGTFTILTSNVEDGSGISVDATHVYWIEASTRDVRAVPVGGGEVVTLHKTEGVPVDTAARGDAIFVTTDTGELVRIPKTTR